MQKSSAIRFRSSRFKKVLQLLTGLFGVILIASIFVEWETLGLGETDSKFDQIERQKPSDKESRDFREADGRIEEKSEDSKIDQQDQPRRELEIEDEIAEEDAKKGRNSVDDRSDASRLKFNENAQQSDLKILPPRISNDKVADGRELPTGGHGDENSRKSEDDGDRDVKTKIDEFRKVDTIGTGSDDEEERTQPIKFRLQDDLPELGRAKVDESGDKTHHVTTSRSPTTVPKKQHSDDQNADQRPKESERDGRMPTTAEHREASIDRGGVMLTTGSNIDENRSPTASSLDHPTSGDNFTESINDDNGDHQLEKSSTSSRNGNASKYACTVPRLNPWDPSIKKFLEHFPTKICRKVQANIVYIDEENYLRFNESELRSINLTSDQVECAYNTIERGNNEEDFQADLGPTRSITTKNPVKLEKDVAQVSCVLRSDRSFLYNGVLTYPVLDTTKKFLQFDQDHTTGRDILNVVLIFIDSMSLSAMRRHMPKTSKFMEQRMGFKAMEGYNKVADNSFPNLIPMLTGKRVHKQQPGMDDEFGEDFTVIFFDHWPLIWKNFSAKGYITAFSEDYPDMGLFHLKGHGFRDKPVDHFYINYWKAMEWMTYPRKSTKDCYGNKTPAQYLLDILRNHLTKFKDYAQFLYMYLTFPAHDDSSHMEYLDEYYYEFFRDAHDRGLFENSFVAFLSDHGQRNSIIRTTNVGLWEERLPSCLLYFPPWFYRKYPHILENLNLNRDRLASNFDIYETMVDILNENFKADGRQRSEKSRGKTFLRPIPPERTCRQAGIPYYFCTCQQMKWSTIPIDSSMAKYAAADFLFALNEKVQRNYKCSRWTLQKLLKAEIMDISAEDAGIKQNTSAAVIESDVYHTNMQLVRVNVRAEIGRGVVSGTFEALMLFNKDENQLSLHSDIGRLDKYGNQSSCIGTDASSQLKKLCVCRDFVTNSTSSG